MNLEAAARWPIRALKALRSEQGYREIAQSADAVLASYPKSGRTWLRFLLANYFLFASGAEVGADLYGMFRVLPNFDRDPERGVPAFAFRKAVPRIPLAPATHLAWRPRRFAGRPVIFLVRDPRDALVSAYFHETRHKRRFSGTMAEFVRDKAFGAGAWAAYHNSWAEGLASHPHIVVAYEELAADARAAAGRCLEFLACPIDAAALSRAVAASRFEIMRALEVEGGLPAHDYDRTDPESLRMRKGEAGGFAAYLSADDENAIGRICAADLSPAAKGMLKRAGYAAVW